jgi:hypothetical protein
MDVVYRVLIGVTVNRPRGPQKVSQEQRGVGDECGTATGST